MRKRKHPLPDIAWLRERFSVDNETGIVTGPRGFPVGVFNDGYLCITPIEGKAQIRAHRLIFALIEGRWPGEDLEIDHKNGIGTDNRWSNLREVTSQENSLNTRTKINEYSRRPRRGYYWQWRNQGLTESSTFFCSAVKGWQESIRARPCMEPQWREIGPRRTVKELKARYRR